LTRLGLNLLLDYTAPIDERRSFGASREPTQRLAEQPGSRPVAILQSQDVTPPGERPLHRFPRETAESLLEEQTRVAAGYVGLTSLPHDSSPPREGSRL
jgi:hypothetical protein